MKSESESGSGVGGNVVTGLGDTLNSGVDEQSELQHSVDTHNGMGRGNVDEISGAEENKTVSSGEDKGSSGVSVGGSMETQKDALQESVESEEKTDEETGKSEVEEKNAEEVTQIIEETIVECCCKYQLYGVTVHHGTMSGGHYICYTHKNRQQVCFFLAVFRSCFVVGHVFVDCW